MPPFPPLPKNPFRVQPEASDTRRSDTAPLRRRLLWLGLLPAALLTALVTVYLETADVLEAERAFQQQGHALARQAAELIGPVAGDPQRLQQTIDRFLERSPAVGLAVRDAAGATIQDQRNTAELPANLEHLRFRYFPTALAPDAAAAETRKPAGQVVITLIDTPFPPEQRRIYRNAALLALLGLLALFPLVRWIERGLSRPMERLIQAGADYAAGDYSARAPETSKGALLALERGFNRLADALEESRSELEQEVNRVTQELTQTLEELEERNAQLDLMRKRAEEATQVKSEFLAKMSHEIRTPMNSVVGFAEQLKKTELAPGQLDLLRLIERSGADLLRLIDDILNYSALEYGAFQPQRSVLDVRETFEHAVALFGPQAHERQLELLLLVYEDVPRRLVGDQTRIRQILANLLANAVKFTEKGEITVRVMAGTEGLERSELIFSVTDTGIGIPPQVRQRLFNSFEQADPSLTRRFGGIGLGLSIAFRLIRAMHGRVNIDSSPGEGSEFTVHLPLLRDPAAPQVDTADDSIFGGRQALLHCRHRRSRLELNHRLEALGLEVTPHDPATPADPDTELLVLGFDAEEAAQQTPERTLNELPPNLRRRTLVLISHSDRERLAAMERRFGCRCLPKPLLTETLQRVLRELLSLDPAPETPEEPPPAQPDPLLSGARVLVVEDNRFNQDLLINQLHNLGCAPKAVDSGQEALKITLDQDFQVILMDIHMPGLSGAETTIRLREREQRLGAPRTLIIALTADVMPDTRTEATAAGVDAILYKPVNEQQLHKVLKEALEGNNRPGLWQPPPQERNGSPPPEDALPVLNREKALTVSGGNAELADELVRRLARELPAYAEDIRRLTESEDAPGLQAATHKLRGALTLCGAQALESVARQLELDLAGGASVTDCAELADSALKELERLRNAVESPSVE